MNSMIKSLHNFFILLVAMCVVAGISSVQAQEADKKGKMKLHHLHMSMMNHGLEMAAQGANLKMIAKMEMDPEVKQEIDSITLEHGRNMLSGGKELIQRALQGSTMKEIHAETDASGKTMQYTHELGNTMLEVIEQLNKMGMGSSSKKAMSLHHIHLALNHALVMATDGSNLIMLGQMGMSPQVDDFSIEHGKKMIAKGKSIWKKTMEGEVMKSLMSSETTDRMESTHKLGDDVQKIFDLLEKMPEA